MNEDYYQSFKNLIIEWIDNNYEDYLNFFGDDDLNNKTRESIAKEEYNYIKSKDSWGSDYTISIACLLFNLDIAVYTCDESGEFTPYHFFENYNTENKELMILSYHTNYHFELIYSTQENQQDNILYESINDIKLNKKISKDDINLTGQCFKNYYVECRSENMKNLYNEIYQFLLSISGYEKEIKLLQIQNPNWHYNQILSKFNLQYPERMQGNEQLILINEKDLESISIHIN